MVTCSAVVVAYTVVTAASVGASPSLKVRQAAQVACATAIEAGKPVGAEVIPACSIANVPPATSAATAQPSTRSRSLEGRHSFVRATSRSVHTGGLQPK